MTKTSQRQTQRKRRRDDESQRTVPSLSSPLSRARAAAATNVSSDDLSVIVTIVSDARVSVDPTWRLMWRRLLADPASRAAHEQQQSDALSQEDPCDTQPPTV